MDLKITSAEINSLIYAYLKNNNFLHTAFVFKKELNDSVEKIDHQLEDLLLLGLQALYVRTHKIPCKNTFSLQPHNCFSMKYFFVSDSDLPINSYFYAKNFIFLKFKSYLCVGKMHKNKFYAISALKNTAQICFLEKKSPFYFLLEEKKITIISLKNFDFLFKLYLKTGTGQEIDYADYAHNDKIKNDACIKIPHRLPELPHNLIRTVNLTRKVFSTAVFDGKIILGEENGYITIIGEEVEEMHIGGDESIIIMHDESEHLIVGCSSGYFYAINISEKKIMHKEFVARNILKIFTGQNGLIFLCKNCIKIPNYAEKNIKITDGIYFNNFLYVLTENRLVIFYEKNLRIIYNEIFFEENLIEILHEGPYIFIRGRKNLFLYFNKQIKTFLGEHKNLSFLHENNEIFISAIFEGKSIFYSLNNFEKSSP